VSGKGKRKSPEQKRCERLRDITGKWEEYAAMIYLVAGKLYPLRIGVGTLPWLQPSLGSP